jgi:hypothetical protein
VPQQIEENILQHVNSKVYDNIPTSEIYDHVSDFLGKSPYPYTKATYRLKQAIMELGPTGYPFEDFVAEVLHALGYQTKVRQILRGTCVTHEIDVVADKEGSRAMVEAKFHNTLGSKSDVQVSLYVKARYDDLREKHGFSEAWLITNTKATDDAAAYAACVGMKVVSWDYPERESLRDMIEKAGLHPITMLTTLSLNLKTKLLENHVVRCKTIHENPAVLDTLGISQEEKQKVLAEITFICGEEHHIV